MAVSDRIIPISKSELDALTGLPHVCYSLYLTLRALMDSESGLVGGDKGRVSWSGLCGTLHVEQKQGRRDADSLTVRKLRHIVDAYLIPVGLVERKSFSDPNNKKLILKLPKSIANNSAKNKFVSDERSDKVPVKNTGKSSNNNTFEGAEKTDELNSSAERFGIYRESYKYNSLSLSRESLVDKNFSPSSENLSRLSALDVLTYHNREQVEKFIAYYQSNGTQCRDWQAKYRAWLIRAKEFARKNQRRNTDGNSFKATRRSGTQSAVEQVRQANEELLRRDIIELEASSYQAPSSASVDDPYRALRAPVHEQFWEGGE